mgnify:CR=1 FL=1
MAKQASHIPPDTADNRSADIHVLRIVRLLSRQAARDQVGGYEENISKSQRSGPNAIVPDGSGDAQSDED